MAHDNVPVFEWEQIETKLGVNFIRNGLPDKYDFEWFEESWTLDK